MRNKIIVVILLITLILTGKVEAATLTQKLGNEYIETTVEKDETVRMIFTSKEGFRFKNWVLIEGDININLNSNDITFSMPNENVTIEVEYDTAYVITFNSNDGTGTTTSMSIMAGATEKLVANPFTREGYRFTGWAEETSGEVIYEDEEECTPNKDLTLYAVWEIAKVTVEFNSNGGDEISSITVTYGSTYGTLPQPIKSGYKFDGWYKEVELINEVTNSTQVTNFSTHTLYAKWIWTTLTIGEIIEIEFPEKTCVIKEKTHTSLYNTEWKIVAITDEGAIALPTVDDIGTKYNSLEDYNNYEIYLNSFSNLFNDVYEGVTARPLTQADIDEWFQGNPVTADPNWPSGVELPVARKMLWQGSYRYITCCEWGTCSCYFCNEDGSPISSTSQACYGCILVISHNLTRDDIAGF